jgi:hypothetical protein
MIHRKSLSLRAARQPAVVIDDPARSGRLRRPRIWLAVFGTAAVILGVVEVNSAILDASSRSRQEGGKASEVAVPVREGPFRFTIFDVQGGRASLGPTTARQVPEGRFFVVGLRVTNVGAQGRALFTGDQLLVDGDRSWELDGQATLVMRQGSEVFGRKIAPGETAQGYVAFDVPKAIWPDYIELHESALSEGARVDL